MSQEERFQEVLNQLKKAYGKGIAPIQVPIMDHDKMIGYINVAIMNTPLVRRFIMQQRSRTTKSELQLCIVLCNCWKIWN